MNSLDELFGEALDRAAMPTTQERRAAVAEVTVHGARRRRRVRAVGQAVGTLAVAALAVGVASLVLTNNDTPPGNATPTPAPSTSPTQPPLQDVEADSRMPQAPGMTLDDWKALDASWDVEFASFRNIYPATSGSTIAVYMTPPGGERKLAYATSDFPPESVSLVAFDPVGKRALFFDNGSREFIVSYLELGRFGDLIVHHTGTLDGAVPLGRTSDGTSIFVVDGVETNGDHWQAISRFDGDGQTPIATGAYVAVSQVWGDMVVVEQDGMLKAVDVANDGAVRELMSTIGCRFQVWNQDGTFVAHCPTSEDGTGDYYTIDPTNDGAELLWVDTPLEDGVTDSFDFLAYSWLDGERKVEGVYMPTYWFSMPPTVIEADGAANDLGADFATVPESYNVIFGARG